MTPTPEQAFEETWDAYTGKGCGCRRDKYQEIAEYFWQAATERAAGIAEKDNDFYEGDGWWSEVQEYPETVCKHIAQKIRGKE